MSAAEEKIQDLEMIIQHQQEALQAVQEQVRALQARHGLGSPASAGAVSRPGLFRAAGAPAAGILAAGMLGVVDRRGVGPVGAGRGAGRRGQKQQRAVEIGRLADPLQRNAADQVLAGRGLKELAVEVGFDITRRQRVDGDPVRRELEREDRIVSFRLTIPDRPGVLGQIATRLGQLGANILEVEHRRLFLDVPAKGAKLDVTVEARDQVHGEEIFQALEAEGYQPVWIDTATTME